MQEAVGRQIYFILFIFMFQEQFRNLSKFRTWAVFIFMFQEQFCNLSKFGTWAVLIVHWVLF